MFALIYLAVMIVFGARLCGRFWAFSSPLHRWSASFLVGLLCSTWVTYLLALAFAWSAKPLLWANILFGALALFAIRRLRPNRTNWVEVGGTRLGKTDAAFIAAFVVISCWLMFGTLNSGQGTLNLSSVVWNDFGPNLALVQSFALGHNFPTEYPYFIGEPIRYHFLFWFQAGNFEFLGLSATWALNLLGVLSLVALLLCIASLGEVLFSARIVGLVAAALFLFQGGLSFIPFFRSQRSIADAFGSVIHLNHWLPSGYPYKGEDWGIWSLSIVYVQRHLVSAIGIFLLVLLFLLKCYEKNFRADTSQSADGTISAPDKQEGLQRESRFANVKKTLDERWQSFIFSGFLIGLLPLWNSAVYVASLAVVTSLLLFFPLRSRVSALLATAILVGLPQVLFLRAGETAGQSSIFHWGYTVENPTVARVLSYFLFTFGPKLALALIAIALLPKAYRFFFVAIAGLVVLAFGTRLSVDIMNNQKFFYVWLVLINLFVAYTLWRLDQVKRVGKFAAAVLLVIITLSGLIEMFRIHNDRMVSIPFNKNALSDWLLNNTKPRDVFLTERVVHHQILMSGRRIFYGWPYFAWSMGYPTGQRDAIYRRMFAERNLPTLVSLLNDNGINYVAIDDGLRHGEFKAAVAEVIFANSFKKVFEDKENRFGRLTIYEVPPHYP